MKNILKASFERMSHFQLGSLIAMQASMESVDGETVIEREYEIYGKIEDLKALAEGAVKSEKQEQWGLPLTLGNVQGNIRVRRTEIIEGSESDDGEGTTLNLDQDDELEEEEIDPELDTESDDEVDIDQDEEETNLDDEEEETDLDLNGEEDNTAPTSGGTVTYTQTIKVKTEEGNEENEMEISEDTFNLFKSMVPNGLIKTRYFYPVKGTDLTLEVDVFEDMNGVQYPLVKIDLEVEEGQSIDEVTLPFKMVEDSIRVIKPGKKTDEDLDYVRALFKRHYEVANPLHQAE